MITADLAVVYFEFIDMPHRWGRCISSAFLFCSAVCLVCYGGVHCPSLQDPPTLASFKNAMSSETSSAEFFVREPSVMNAPAMCFVCGFRSK